MQNNSVQNLINVSSERIRDEMLNYMNVKYGKKFIGLSLEQRGVDRDSDKLICYADGENSNEDLAYVYREINGGVIEYSDTYFGVTIRNEVVSELEKICHASNFSSKVFFDTLTRIYTNEYDKSKTFSDLKSDTKQPGLLVEVALTSDLGGLNEIECKKLADSIKDTHLRGIFTFYYFSQSTFESISATNENEFLTPVNDAVIAYYNVSLD